MAMACMRMPAKNSSDALLQIQEHAAGAEANERISTHRRPARSMRRHATTMIAAVLCLLLFSSVRLAAAEKSFGGGGGGYGGLEAGGAQQQQQQQPQAEASGAAAGGGGGYSTPSEAAPATPAAEETPTPTPTTPAAASSSGGDGNAAAGSSSGGGYSGGKGGGGGLDPDGDPEVGLNAKAIKEILDEHNAFRAKEPAALPPLVWNATLARFSQQYAETALKGSCQQIHSSSPYGENLMEGTPGLTWKITVDGWSEEKKSYHYDTDTCDPGKMCGHYKAVVWKDTTSVGCGRIKCDSGDTIIMCSYWPPGNYDGVKPY